METLRIAKGMSSHPAWTEVLRDVWQYGLSMASSIGQRAEVSAEVPITSHIINSMEHIDLAVNRAHEALRYKGHPVFQYVTIS